MQVVRSKMRLWAWYDDEGSVVRLFDYPAEGAESYPPMPKQLEPDDPEWFNIPF